MPCRLGEGTGPKGPGNGEAPQRLKHQATSYRPRVLRGEVVQVPRRLGEGTGPKGPANGEAPQRLQHEAPSYLPTV